MPSNSHFEQLEAVLRDWLPQVAVKSDELLKASLPRLVSGPFPEWLALRQLSFCWRCCSQFAGKESRFLFGSERTSAREMLDARLELGLRPSPLAEPALAPADPQAAQVIFPRLLRRDRTFPESASASARQLILKLGNQDTLVCWDPIESDVKGGRIQARWIRGDTARALGPKGAWPLELMLSLVRVLAAADASEPGEQEAYAALNPDFEVWELADSALRLAETIPDYLEPERQPFERSELEPLRSRWNIGNFSVRAGALVNPSAQLAQPSEGDTFLAPFRIEWEPGAERAQLKVVLELPDVVARGELRAALLEAFQDPDVARVLAKLLNQAVPSSALTPEAVQSWCVPENTEAQVVRINRKSEVDEYMLVLTRTVAGAPVAVLVLSRSTRLGLVEGRLKAELDDVDEVFVGRREEIDLEWDGGSEWLVRMLAILLRWRRLLP